jgi:hypothetical protein
MLAMDGDDESRTRKCNITGTVDQINMVMVHIERVVEERFRLRGNSKWKEIQNRRNLEEITPLKIYFVT